MLLKTRDDLHRQFPWQASAALFCTLFGLMLVLIIHPDGDGSWFWYSTLFRGGARLYRDLHLALQPMLVLEIATVQRALGTGWLSSLATGTANVLLYVGALLSLTRFSHWRHWEKALILTCAFVTTTDFLTIRFDDYHVLSSFLETSSLVLLLLLSRMQSTKSCLAVITGLGALSGLCITNRLNDGAALLCAVLMVVPWLLPARRTAAVVAACGTVCIVAAVTVTVVVAATGDSLHDWAFYSIQRAAAIKGGTGHVLLYPLRLPWLTLLQLFIVSRRVAVCVVMIVMLTLLMMDRQGERLRRWRVPLLLLLSLGLVRPLWAGGAVAHGLAGLGTLTMLIAAGAVLWRLWLTYTNRTPSGWSPMEALVLLPAGQLMSISMSSARWYPNTFPPVAAFVLIAPIAFGPWLAQRRRHRAFLLFVALLTISAFAEKLRSPFHWWNYQATSLTAKRVWYQHPAYGPMLVQADELHLVKPVCDTIAAETMGSRELLSLPFPYANYFCGIPPWHGYVQTFFDTSSKATIDALMSELRTNPPQWIFYQRQMRVLRAHEEAFQGGQPLPHRALDLLIEDRIHSGVWKARPEAAPEGDDSQWVLIQTR